MTKLRVHNFAITVDGCSAGPDQSRKDPAGVGGERILGWVHETRSFHRSFGIDGGKEGVDDAFMTRGIAGIGATIMGRNMFGPVRGRWEDSEEWSGWWGDEPPFHHPVFVLTHHRRDPITLSGGTIFHFVTGGIEDALEQAVEAAAGADVRVGGGPATVRQFLRAGLVDEMHLAIVPVLLGRGERVFDDHALTTDFECVEFVSSPAVAHARFVRTSPR
jgi:dihydrofolate reductase